MLPRIPYGCDVAAEASIVNNERAELADRLREQLASDRNVAQARYRGVYITIDVIISNWPYSLARATSRATVPTEISRAKLEKYCVVKACDRGLIGSRASGVLIRITLIHEGTAGSVDQLERPRPAAVGRRVKGAVAKIRN